MIIVIIVIMIATCSDVIINSHPATGFWAVIIDRKRGAQKMHFFYDHLITDFNS